MDIWSPEPQRRQKRSFTEMSHPATLSPSPVSFGEPASANFFSSRFPSVPSNNPFASLFERRRTPHPHNHNYQRPSEEMSERSQSHHRPSLEHRASQTIIDLTDDREDTPVISRSTNRLHSQRPPALGRSDAVNLGDFIDLTDDNGDPDIIITGGRQLPLPRPSAARPVPPALPAPRRDSPSLFMPPAPQPQPNSINRVFAAHRHNLGLFAGRAADVHAQYNLAARFGQDIMEHIQGMQDEHQPMPGVMNYQQPAFAAEPNRKPEHVPPPPAQEGFTRSPDENDILICPSCEEELVHDKAEDPIVNVKKGSKAPTKKEREEHPFWVLKECGHVFCNNCYQHRMSSGKHGAVGFRETTKSSSKGKSAKSFLCSVEDCESDVKSKEKWVGVFM